MPAETVGRTTTSGQHPIGRRLKSTDPQTTIPCRSVDDGGHLSLLNLSALFSLSPFHYYIGNEPLTNGFQWAHTAVLLAISAVLLAAGVFSLRNRDLAS